jgi:predicted homoserine dehydrogenase-like protein
MYLSDLAPVHSAVAAFLTATTTWNLTTTRAQATADAAPLMAAIRTFDSELSSTPWPANATADVKTLITEDKVIIADLTALDVITHATVGAWEVNIAADTNVDASDSNLVRSDLGLPQATLPA